DDASYIFDSNRSAVEGAENSLLNVRRRLEVPSSANTVFRPAEFDQTRTGFGIAPFYCFHHSGKGNSIRAQAVRIHVNLILGRKSTQGRHFRDSRNGLQII